MKVTSSLILLAAASSIVALAQTSGGTSTSASKIKHVVIIFQENRTPDNLFYGLCQAPYGSAASCSTTPGAGQYNIKTANWLDNSSSTGVTQPLPEPLAIGYDMSHAHPAFTLMCDADANGNCKMDGASGTGCSGTCLTQPQFRYVDNSTGVVNPYMDLATQYGWANYMFQTNQGPSFPAHQFIFGGTSAPSAADDMIGTFAAENMSHSGTAGTSTDAGCAAPAGTTVQLITANGVETPKNKIYPCFQHDTVPDLLPAGLTWRYYAPNAGSIWTAPNAISSICGSTGQGGECAGTLWKNNVDLKSPDVLTDIASCNLRTVSWVIPNGYYSDHPGTKYKGVPTDEGPSWVGNVVNAIGNSNCENGQGYWNDTAIIIAWDDWGGFYDHEPPTVLPYPQGGYQLGFRVPMIVVSAYTPKGYINNYHHDFGSVLRFVENTFGLQQLGFADTRAKNDLGLFFDFSANPRPFQPIKTALPASYFINDTRPAADPDDQ